MKIDKNAYERINFLVGNREILESIQNVPNKEPFSVEICAFLSDVSKVLMDDKRSRRFSDVVTFAFWIRAASLTKLKDRFVPDDGKMRLGKGTAFHIAPSNVPVNFAYSLASGLLTGNTNIVRVPTKEFPQVEILADAINEALSRNEEMKPYVILCRYERDKEINDVLSMITDTRIIWGGDATIAEIRKSPLPPRSTEITFADRYSLAVIDSDEYMSRDDKDRIANDFYNDTYFSDQNACTSPRLVVWIGTRREEAKEEFWNRLHKTVTGKYGFQDIMGVDKLTRIYSVATAKDGTRLLPREDNLLFRIDVDAVDSDLMELKENCGFFFEFDCDDVMELWNICNDKKCQTITLLGEKNWLRPLIAKGVKGVDRIVDIGKSMDFDLIWDGYELTSMLTRIIAL